MNIHKTTTADSKTYKSIYLRFAEFIRQTGVTEHPVLVNSSRAIDYMRHKQTHRRTVNGKTVPFSSFLQIAFALSRTYEAQYDRGINCFPDPREDILAEAKRLTQLQKSRNKTTTHVASLQKHLQIDPNTYAFDEIESIVFWGIRHSSISSSSSFSYVSIISQMLLCQSLVQSANYLDEIFLKNVRFATYHQFIRDSYTSAQYEKDHPQSKVKHATEMLVFTNVKKSKTFKKLLSVCCLRNASVYMCPHFWLASHLVNRFHCLKEQPPLLDNRQNLSSFKIFTNTETVRDSFYKMLNGPSNEIADSMSTWKTTGTDFSVRLSNNVTTVPKNSAIAHYKRICMDKEEPVVSVSARYAGLFNSFGEYDYSTLSSIPAKALVSLAGRTFSTSRTPEGVIFNCKMNRNAIKPSQELKNMLFPFINATLEKNKDRFQGSSHFPPLFKPGEDSSSDIFKENTDELAYQIAVTLDYLREIFIQDYKFFVEWLDIQTKQYNAQRESADNAHSNTNKKPLITKVQLSFLDLDIWKSDLYLEFRKSQDAYLSQINVDDSDEDEDIEIIDYFEAALPSKPSTNNANTASSKSHSARTNPNEKWNGLESSSTGLNETRRANNTTDISNTNKPTSSPKSSENLSAKKFKVTNSQSPTNNNNNKASLKVIKAQSARKVPLLPKLTSSNSNAPPVDSSELKMVKTNDAFKKNLSFEASNSNTNNNNQTYQDDDENDSDEIEIIGQSSAAGKKRRRPKASSKTTTVTTAKTPSSDPTRLPTSSSSAYSTTNESTTATLEKLRQTVASLQSTDNSLSVVLDRCKTLSAKMASLEKIIFKNNN